MCGRFAAATDILDAANAFAETHGRTPEDWSPDWRPRYNLKPTNRIPVLIDSAKTASLRFETAHWSLIPPWAKERRLKFPTFNARAETLTDKAAWRGPVKHQRCIVLASGYFEWTGTKGAKQPWYLRREDTQPLGFAGLYSWWKDPDRAEDDPWLLTATIVTSAAPAELASIHDRAPVMLPQSHWAEWIDPETIGTDELVSDMAETSISRASEIEFHQVEKFGLEDDGSKLLTPKEV